MMTAYYCLVAFAAAQRLLELLYAKRTRRILERRGFTQSEKSADYLMMVVLHTAWFVALLAEPRFFLEAIYLPLSIVALVSYIAAQLGRGWVLLALGKHWNTTVMSSNSSEFIQTGPYRWIRHPNYLVVIIEFLSLPLIGGSYLTAIVFSVLNAMILRRRITHEEMMLQRRSGYKKYSLAVPMLFPFRFSGGA